MNTAVVCVNYTYRSIRGKKVIIKIPSNQNVQFKNISSSFNRFLRFKYLEVCLIKYRRERGNPLPRCPCVIEKEILYPV